MENMLKNVDIGISDSLFASLIGILLVFSVLAILIIFIKVLSYFIKNDKKSSAKKAPEKNEEKPVYADGSAGKVNIFDVPNKTAALLMAIVADKTGIPINQLKFISIREIKDGSDSNEI